MGNKNQDRGSKDPGPMLLSYGVWGSGLNKNRHQQQKRGSLELQQDKRGVNQLCGVQDERKNLKRGDEELKFEYLMGDLSTDFSIPVLSRFKKYWRYRKKSTQYRTEKFTKTKEFVP
jgi:hypothetical protein